MARDSQLSARDAIFDAIKETVEESKDYAPGPRAEVLRDLGFAFRLAAGGPQPGSVDVQSK